MGTLGEVDGESGDAGKMRPGLNRRVQHVNEDIGREGHVIQDVSISCIFPRFIFSVQGPRKIRSQCADFKVEMEKSACSTNSFFRSPRF